MKIWIHINDAQEGPFAIDQLPVDRIAPDTPVWHEGLTDWAYAKDVPALAHLFAPKQEPIEPSELSEPDDETDLSEMASEQQQPWQEQPQHQQPWQQQPHQQPWQPQPHQQPWQPQPHQQPWQPQPQYPPHQQYSPGPQGPWQPAYPQNVYGYPGQMHRPMPQRHTPAQPPMPGAEAAPKVPSMWLWASIPLTIIFTGNLFGIIAIVLGIISRKKYNAGAYASALKLSQACEWLIIVGITFGFATIPFTMFF